MIGTREEMLDHLGLEGKECAEIGVFEGYYAGQILKRNPKSLLLVDPWKHQSKRVYVDDPANKSDDWFEDIYKKITETLGADPRVRIIRDESYFAAQGLENESLDFVYVDAIHTFEGCFCDILAWFPKVRTGGWLCGHDYTGGKDCIHPGVRMAVEAFSRLTGHELNLLCMQEYASWGLIKKPRRP